MADILSAVERLRRRLCYRGNNSERFNGKFETDRLLCTRKLSLEDCDVDLLEKILLVDFQNDGNQKMRVVVSLRLTRLI